MPMYTMSAGPSKTDARCDSSNVSLVDFDASAAGQRQDHHLGAAGVKFCTLRIQFDHLQAGLGPARGLGVTSTVYGGVALRAGM